MLAHQESSNSNSDSEDEGINQSGGESPRFWRQMTPDDFDQVDLRRQLSAISATSRESRGGGGPPPQRSHDDGHIRRQLSSPSQHSSDEQESLQSNNMNLGLLQDFSRMKFQELAADRAAAPSAPASTDTRVWDQKTSVLLMNVPSFQTQNMLVAELNSHGFMGTFDLLYLPCDLKTGVNKLHAYINFVESHYARLCAATFHKRLPGGVSGPAMQAVPSPLQGFDANLDFYHRTCERPLAPLFLKQMPMASGNQGRNLPTANGGSKVCRFCTQCGHAVDNRFCGCVACGAGVVIPVACN